MKTGFNQEEQQSIRRAKEILRRLVRQATLNQQTLLEQLSQQGFEIQQSTFSTWLSPKALNVRPKPDILLPLIQLCCPARSPAQHQEVLDELNRLFGFETGPLTAEQIHNRVAHYLDDPPLSLTDQKDRLQNHLKALNALLDLIEPRVMDYGCYNPVIFVEAQERRLVKQLLGNNKDNYRDYEVEEGYEIPLTRIQSVDAMVRILDDLGEGARLLQRYLDRHLNDTRGLEQLDVYRVEDYLSYAWEISDRLLHHNPVIKALPALKRALLRQMTICQGIRYVLDNLSRDSSEIAFQNVLALKSRDFELDIHCSVAVFVGMLARQQIRTGVASRIERGLKLYRRAVDWLEKYHLQLSTEQEIYHYKKELANLHYDLANFSLAHQQLIPGFDAFFSSAMSKASRLYREVLDSENLFVQGLSLGRLNHLRLFACLSICWSETASKAEKALAALETPDSLDENYWTIQIAHAIAFAILARRWPKRALSYQHQAKEALEKARLVNGFAARTDQEIAAEYVLSELMLMNVS